MCGVEEMNWSYGMNTNDLVEEGSYTMVFLKLFIAQWGMKNGKYFADDICKCILSEETFGIHIWMSFPLRAQSIVNKH